MYLEARRLGRYTYIHYIVPNDWEKVLGRELEN